MEDTMKSLAFTLGAATTMQADPAGLLRLI
jgi:hypothetical protein